MASCSSINTMDNMVRCTTFIHSKSSPSQRRQSSSSTEAATRQREQKSQQTCQTVSEDQSAHHNDLSVVPGKLT